MGKTDFGTEFILKGLNIHVASEKVENTLGEKPPNKLYF